MCVSVECVNTTRNNFPSVFFFITKQCVNYSGNFFVFLCICCSCFFIKTTCFCVACERQTWKPEGFLTSNQEHTEHPHHFFSCCLVINSWLYHEIISSLWEIIKKQSKTPFHLGHHEPNFPLTFFTFTWFCFLEFQAHRHSTHSSGH